MSDTQTGKELPPHHVAVHEEILYCVLNSQYFLRAATRGFDCTNRPEQAKQIKLSQELWELAMDDLDDDGIHRQAAMEWFRQWSGSERPKYPQAVEGSAL